MNRKFPPLEQLPRIYQLSHRERVREIVTVCLVLMVVFVALVVDAIQVVSRPDQELLEQMKPCFRNLTVTDEKQPMTRSSRTCLIVLPSMSHIAHQNASLKRSTSNIKHWLALVIDSALCVLATLSMLHKIQLL
jgi:hypothetical protein